MNDNQIRLGNRTQARGAILIVALVMLLIITALGLNAISQSSTGLKIAKNSSQRTVAFQSAENIRIDAVQSANNIAAALGATPGAVAFPAAQGRYDVSSGAAAPAVGTRAFWQTSANYQTTSGSDGYVVEYLGRQALIPEANRAAGTTVNVHVFRTTLHSQVNGQVDTALQMIYVTNCSGAC